MDTNNSRIDLPSVTTDEAIDVLLAELPLHDIQFSSKDETTAYQVWCEKILKHESKIGIELTTEQRLETWYIEEPFRSMDVRKFLLDKCNTPEEIARVEYEYKLFVERDFLIMLRLLIYLVDHFRKHKYIWGIGRGSSVASFSLYLIGINKINPLTYNLDIHEFLK